MKKSLMMFLAIAVTMAACKNEKKGPGGLLYTIYKDAGKSKIKEGDIVKMNFIQKTQKDSVLFSSYESGQPQVFPVQKAMYKGDMNDVLSLFGEGDSATFKIDLDTMAARSKQPRPEQFKNDKYLQFVVKIEKVYSKDKGEADSTFQKRVSDILKKEQEETLAKNKAAEPAKIKGYIEDQKWKPTVSASGLQYVIEKPGDAVKAGPTDTLEVNYVGMVAVKKEGKYPIFDTNIEKVAKESGLDKKQMGRKYEPAKMLTSNVVPGFAEALTLVGKGGKVKALMPSKLAYGDQGIPQAGITPSSPLVFEIEVVNIIKPSAAKAAPQAPPAAKAKK